MKDGLVRATHLPLVLRVGGTDSLPRNALVRVRLTGVDLLTLDAYANLVARVDEPVADQIDETDDALGDDDEAPPTTGLALAIDVGDAGPDGAAAPTADAPTPA
jgi:exoribonuclease-2